MIDHWRRNQRQTKSETSIDDVTHEPHFEQSQVDPSEILEHQQRIQRLSEALETLPPRRREAFLLYRFDGLSQSEIAERMEISISMVEKHIAAALVHCKNTLIIRAIIRNDTTLCKHQMMKAALMKKPRCGLPACTANVSAPLKQSNSNNGLLHHLNMQKRMMPLLDYGAILITCRALLAQYFPRKTPFFAYGALWAIP